jgi:hypothetical protein
MTKQPPVCPIHKVELRPAVFNHMPHSLEPNGQPLRGFDCPVTGCKIKHCNDVAADVGGFFTLDENGKVSVYAR